MKSDEVMAAVSQARVTARDRGRLSWKAAAMGVCQTWGFAPFVAWRTNVRVNDWAITPALTVTFTEAMREVKGETVFAWPYYRFTVTQFIRVCRLPDS